MSKFSQNLSPIELDEKLKYYKNILNSTSKSKRNINKHFDQKDFNARFESNMRSKLLPHQKSSYDGHDFLLIQWSIGLVLIGIGLCLIVWSLIKHFEI